MLPQIIKQMNERPYIDKKGRVYRYGEFFPIEISPFAYNETIAQEYFPLIKEEAIHKGYPWEESDANNYKITVMPENLPDNIKDVDDSILKEIIGCTHKGKCYHRCVGAFRLIPQELEFYRQLNLPLPRLCYNCRHYNRVAQRNSFKLWHRSCQCAGLKSENGVYQNIVQHFHGKEKCPNQFKTSYNPERPEIVYCEQCYNAEVV